MAPCPPGVTGARSHESRRRDGESRGHGPPLVTGQAPQPVPSAAHVHGRTADLADRRRVHTGRTYGIRAGRPYEISVRRAYKRSVLCHGTTTCDERSACDPTMRPRGGARRSRWTTDELWTLPTPNGEVPRRGNACQRPSAPISAGQCPSAPVSANRAPVEVIVTAARNPGPCHPAPSCTDSPASRSPAGQPPRRTARPAVGPTFDANTFSTSSREMPSPASAPASRSVTKVNEV